MWKLQEHVILTVDGASLMASPAAAAATAMVQGIGVHGIHRLRLREFGPLADPVATEDSAYYQGWLRSYSLGSGPWAVSLAHR